MMLEDIYEEKYDITYKKIYYDIKDRKDNDDTYTIHKLRALLESLYVSEGNNWIGRGEIKAVVNAATIAACETVLVEWEEEIKRNKASLIG